MIFRTRRAVSYQEPNILESVAQYHQLFRLTIPTSPRMPESSERCQLLVSMLREEVQGLKAAMETKKSLVQAASALANLQYAIGRAVLEFGMGGLFLSMFDEVHRSHMSKICNSLSEAKATQRFHRSRKGMDSVIETIVPKQEEQDAATQSKWLVLRSKDHKMLKSVKYAPANLAVILTRAMEAADKQSDESISSSSSNDSPMSAFFLMASPSGLSSVAEYHTSMTGSVPPSNSSPQWPTRERCQWRLNILESKLKELELAIRQKDVAAALIKIAHSLTNMQYSLSGAVLEFGMASVFQSIFDEVHRSHMSEACATVEEAQETIQHYLHYSRQQQQPELPTGTIPEHPEEDREEEPTDSEDFYDEENFYYSPQPVQHGTKWLVYQQGSSQVLKSIKYTPAKIDSLLLVPPSA